jgi:hypothetical protein
MTVLPLMPLVARPARFASPHAVGAEDLSCDPGPSDPIVSLAFLLEGAPTPWWNTAPGLHRASDGSAGSMRDFPSTTFLRVRAGLLMRRSGKACLTLTTHHRINLAALDRAAFFIERRQSPMAATLHFNLIQKRILDQQQAAVYVGLKSKKKFQAICPVQPIALGGGVMGYDVRDLDGWIDGLKHGAANDNVILLERLSA